MSSTPTRNIKKRSNLGARAREEFGGFSLIIKKRKIDTIQR